MTEGGQDAADPARWAQFYWFWSAYLDALERRLNRMDESTPAKRKTARKRRGPGREPIIGETK